MKSLKPIARKRRNYIYLLLSILFAILTGYIFVNFPPDYSFNLKIVNFPILPLFFMSFAVFIFSISTFIFIKRLQGTILTIFILGYAFMRLIGLTHWLFALLLFALFITTELFIYKKK